MEVETTNVRWRSAPLPVLLSIRASNKPVMTAKELEAARKRAAQNMIQFRHDKLLYPFWRGLFNYYKKKAAGIQG